MADHESPHFDDEAPISSTHRLDRPTLNIIHSILRARFGISAGDIHVDSRFVEDLGIDLFDLPDLILALEEDLPTKAEESANDRRPSALA